MTFAEEAIAKGNAADVERVAADWVARLDSRYDGVEAGKLALYADEDPAFKAWLEASISHRVALLRLIAGWSEADRLAALGSSNMERPRSRFWGLPRHSARIAASVAAMFFVVAAGFAISSRISSPATKYQTYVGGYETVAMADGSRVELNTDTTLTANVTDETRSVVLAKGEAYFEIAHDETKPFIVYAGQQQVTVLGTRFSVRRTDDGIEVAVTEARVQVASRMGDSAQPPTVLLRGQIARSDSGGVLVVYKAPEEVERTLSWRRGFLVFDQTPLSVAVEEFNRYNVVQLEITDPKIAEIRVGGSFRVNNVEAFSRLLSEAFSLNLRREGDRIIIFS